jgi:antibiotic biosynthesis monooxygenase (ABM) superfamily enzyme
MMAMGIYFDASERKSVWASIAPVLVAVDRGGGDESQAQQARGGLSQWFSVGVSPDQHLAQPMDKAPMHNFQTLLE